MTEPPGFKKPPKASQFVAGQSGNPKGRPKGSRNLHTDMNALMSQQVVVNENGRAKRLSRQEALLLTIFARGMKGDSTAAAKLFAMFMKLDGAATPAPAQLPLKEEDEAIIADVIRRHNANK